MAESYRVADYIAQFVAELGVGHIFLLPGGGNMHLVDAVGKHPDIDVVACLHEQAAAISAEAYARISENIGVVMVTTGPGATNAITAVTGAWIESVPMLVISGQVKRADMKRDNSIRQKGAQEVDIISMVQGITKYALTIEEPESIRAVLEEAVHHAKSRRAGPVWIDVPLDVQGAPIEPSQLVGWESEPLIRNEVIAADDLEQLQSLLANSERPVVLAGHGVRLAGGAKMFRLWVERLEVPIVTTWNALDILPYDHSLNIGRPGVVALRAPNLAVQNSDLLISIGSRLDNIITAYNSHGFARAAKKVVINVDINEISNLKMELSLSITADAKQALEQLLQQPVLSNPKWQTWIEQCNSWKRRYSLANEKDFSDEKEMTHYQFVDQLSELLPEQRILSTGSSGLAIEAFYSAFRNREGQRIFLTSGLGSMGYGLPAAIGACFANEKQAMYAIESDGSLQLNIQELATLHAFNLPIKLVVMNNSGYASIRTTQRNYFEGRYVGTGPEAGLFLPDLESLANCYKLEYYRVKDKTTLKRAIEEAEKQAGPVVIDVNLCSDEALSPKVAALPQKDGSILSMPLEDMSPLLPLEQLQKEMLIDLLPVSVQARRIL
jgi:acetolactate synthase-1/2/3 large subunit